MWQLTHHRIRLVCQFRMYEIQPITCSWASTLTPAKQTTNAIIEVVFADVIHIAREQSRRDKKLASRYKKRWAKHESFDIIQQSSHNYYSIQNSVLVPSVLTEYCEIRSKKNHRFCHNLHISCTWTDWFGRSKPTQNIKYHETKDTGQRWWSLEKKRRLEKGRRRS